MEMNGDKMMTKAGG
jgi:ubiquitin carboxyl-terminal hydrolase 14